MKVVHLTGESRYEEKNQQKHSNYEENEVFQKMNFTDSGSISKYHCVVNCNQVYFLCGKGCEQWIDT